MDQVNDEPNTGKEMDDLWSCFYCPRGFKTRPGRNLHMSLKHQEELHKCFFCGSHTDQRCVECQRPVCQQHQLLEEHECEKLPEIEIDIRFMTISLYESIEERYGYHIPEHPRTQLLDEIKMNHLIPEIEKHIDNKELTTLWENKDWSEIITQLSQLSTKLFPDDLTKRVYWRFRLGGFKKFIEENPDVLQLERLGEDPYRLHILLIGILTAERNGATGKNAISN